MTELETISIQKTTESRLPNIDFKDLKFGTTFADHMFVMDYIDGKWHKPQIIPFQNMTMSPAASVIHYGQSVFEGLKAYKNEKEKRLHK